MKKFYIKQFRLSITGLSLVITIILLTVKQSKAQLNPLGSQYFNNQYLANPAMAGIGEGLNLNMAYRQQWSRVPGSPQLQNFTADYGFNKVGLGISVLNDKAGLQRQTRVVGTYAYHLPLSESQTLHFGVSFGFMNQRLEGNDISGDQDDILVGQYNARDTYIDGDFGLAYTSGGLNIQAALPNLKSFFKKDDIKVADVATFYSAISYKIKLTEGTEGIGIEPKAALRGVKGLDNMWDAGAQLTLADEQIMLSGLYHSTESATFGLGMNYKKKYLISGMYTTQTSALTGYGNGTFELSLRLFLKRKSL
jgi:type IX secretion system PorP/SprF family membrane protein